MVLNMADFDKSWKSLQTLKRFQNPPKHSETVNWFLTPCTTVSVDFGWIRKARKLADFEQKAWAIAHGFEHGRFLQVLQIAPNTLKRFQNPPKLIFNSLHDCFRRFRVNSQGSKIGRFWAKSLGYSPWFWTWPILTSSANRSKLWNGSKTLPNWFLTPCTTVSVDFGWIRKARKLADFEQKAWAIAHGFEHGRFWQVCKSLQTLWNGSKTLPNWFLTPCKKRLFWQVLEIAPKSLKRFQNPPKLSISGEFARLENWPILSKKPGL